MITITLHFGSWFCAVLGFFLAMKAAQRSGVIYERGENWMPDAILSILVFFGTIFAVAFVGIEVPPHD